MSRLATLTLFLVVALAAPTLVHAELLDQFGDAVALVETADNLRTLGGGDPVPIYELATKRLSDLLGELGPEDEQLRRTILSWLGRAHCGAGQPAEGMELLMQAVAMGPGAEEARRLGSWLQECPSMGTDAAVSAVTDTVKAADPAASPGAEAPTIEAPADAPAAAVLIPRVDPETARQAGLSLSLHDRGGDFRLEYRVKARESGDGHEFSLPELGLGFRFDGQGNFELLLKGAGKTTVGFGHVWLMGADETNSIRLEFREGALFVGVNGRTATVEHRRLERLSEPERAWLVGVSGDAVITDLRITVVGDET